MSVADLSSWLDEMGRLGNFWYVKRLSANDTLATGAHQAGFYIPKDVIFRAFPSLQQPAALNPRVEFDAFIDSHSDHRRAKAIWYNNKIAASGTRDEVHVTNWGGGSSALLDPESTGALAVFVFVDGATGADATALHVWVCEGLQDESVEDRLGPVEPGQSLVLQPGNASATSVPSPANCWLAPSEMPPSWLSGFPTGAAIVRKSVELRPLLSDEPDLRLVRRRACEFEIFKSVEHALESERVAKGFPTIELFLERAQTVLQRRKARSGRSLELHTREILIEEGFVEGAHFSHDTESEGARRPDFLFPSQAAYRDPSFPVARLRMLAAKTSLRDRWRQILNEADRIPRKHLLTLQEGVSTTQFAEMEASSVQLVVPRSLLDAYPKSIRPRLMTISDFFAEVRTLNVGTP